MPKSRSNRASGPQIPTMDTRRGSCICWTINHMVFLLPPGRAPRVMPIVYARSYCRKMPPTVSMATEKYCSKSTASGQIVAQGGQILGLLNPLSPVSPTRLFGCQLSEPMSQTLTNIVSAHFCLAHVACLRLVPQEGLLIRSRNSVGIGPTETSGANPEDSDTWGPTFPKRYNVPIYARLIADFRGLASSTAKLSLAAPTCGASSSVHCNFNWGVVGLSAGWVLSAPVAPFSRYSCLCIMHARSSPEG